MINLLDRFKENEIQNKDDLLYLIELICDMNDFTHLLRWDDGKAKVKAVGGVGDGFCRGNYRLKGYKD